ncbi:MAG: exosortase [Bryobacterales bacterium]|nr:exosortase [Bryobacterales bacterium]
MATTTEPVADLRLNAIPWMKIAWAAALLALCFGDVLFDMAKEWYTDDDMSHGFFVPVVAGYVAWQRRDKILSLPMESNPFGIVLIIWGGLQLILGTIGAEMFVSRTAFLVSLIGVLLYLGGTRLVRELAFPLFLLVFMIRIPAIIYKQITFPLQLFASEVAEKSLSLLGIPVLREGNILELADHKLSVVEACSGIRSLLSLSFLSLIYAYFFDTKIWMRAALLIATIPIAVAANAFRVTLTGIVSDWKREFAEGFFHSMEGWVVFLVAFVILIATHQILNRAYSALKRTS